MPIDNRNKFSVRFVAVISLLALAAGFGVGVLGAHAALQTYANEDEQAVTATVTSQNLSFPVPVVQAATVKKVIVPTKPPVKQVTNTLVVSRMGVNSAVLEGKSEKTLNKGLWHVPGTSTPAKGGNTVISAHRYMWRPPSTKTFWDIDKMKVGDPISLTWEGKEYHYAVAKVSIVKPSKVDILANTKTPKLTLFSCTPKFTSKNRIVVEAYPVQL